MGNRFVSRRKSNFAQWMTHGASTNDITDRPYLRLSTVDEPEIGLIVEDYLRGSLE